MVDAKYRKKLEIEKNWNGLIVHVFALINELQVSISEYDLLLFFNFKRHLFIFCQFYLYLNPSHFYVYITIKSICKILI